MADTVEPPIHDDDGRDAPWPTGREWRVRTPELDNLEATLNALEDLGFRCDYPDRIDEDAGGPPRYLVLGLYEPEDDEPDDAEEPARRPLPDAVCERDGRGGC